MGSVREAREMGKIFLKTLGSIFSCDLIRVELTPCIGGHRSGSLCSILNVSKYALFPAHVGCRYHLPSLVLSLLTGIVDPNNNNAPSYPSIRQHSGPHCIRFLRPDFFPPKYHFWPTVRRAMQAMGRMLRYVSEAVIVRRVS